MPCFQTVLQFLHDYLQFRKRRLWMYTSFGENSQLSVICVANIYYVGLFNDLCSDQ